VTAQGRDAAAARQRPPGSHAGLGHNKSAAPGMHSPCRRTARRAPAKIGAGSSKSTTPETLDPSAARRECQGGVTSDQW